MIYINDCKTKEKKVLMQNINWLVCPWYSLLQIEIDGSCSDAIIGYLINKKGNISLYFDNWVLCLFNYHCDGWGWGVALYKYCVCLQMVLKHIRVVKPKPLDPL